MARNSKKSRKKEAENEESESVLSRIAPETKKSITAILLLGLAAILALASFEAAGPVGSLIFKTLGKLFGIGYYFIPAVALLVAVLLLVRREQKFLGITFIGAGLLIIFSLGLVDVIFPEKAGWTGRLIGTLEVPFGQIAAMVILSTLIVVSFLITFNVALKFPRFEFKKKNEEIDAETLVIKNSQGSPEEPGDEDAAEEKEKKKDEESEMIEPIIAEPAVAAIKLKKKPIMPEYKDYVPPPLDLLKSTSEKPTAGDLRANANIIKRTLESFGIPVEMGEISIGPKVTRYTLKPAEGVKLTKITTLNQDLALALAAHPIRIEAPIPGKSLVGIEVPNKAAAIVRLGSLMAYPDFSNSGLLGFPLGRDVSGDPIFADIEHMPHLLIAGSTGSGKSIAIHSILTSLLYKNSPETLKMILIDPKRVELSAYGGIPHLVAPVITEAKKAIAVFRWAIQEMENRYDTLLKAGSRDIKSYNKNDHGRLPYLVIVIDELADLMASYGREIEGSIVRLAQMARATGIHLVVSTQRPSVEVITGLIKANITARMALQVASQVDSRTILDTSGAEKLLGGGDMLFISAEFSKPKRIQGAYIGEEEITKVTDFIREHNEIAEAAAESIHEVIDEVVAGGKEDVFEDYEGSDDDDELLEEAIRVVKEAKKASASLLQRRLKIGYARAARLLDIMEAKGMIGPGDGAKPREILID